MLGNALLFNEQAGCLVIVLASDLRQDIQRDTGRVDGDRVGSFGFDDDRRNIIVIMDVTRRVGRLADLGNAGEIFDRAERNLVGCVFGDFCVYRMTNTAVFEISFRHIFILRFTLRNKLRLRFFLYVSFRRCTHRSLGRRRSIREPLRQ